MNRGNILFEETDQHKRNSKLYFFGQVLFLSILGIIVIFTSLGGIDHRENLVWLIIGLILVVLGAILTVIYLIERRTDDKFRVHEFGINLGDTREPFFIPFEDIKSIEKVQSMKGRPAIKIYKKNGDVVKIASRRAKDAHAVIDDIDTAYKLIDSRIK